LKLLREYIRELLTESNRIDPKIYDMIARADDLGYKVELSSYEAALVDGEGNHVAKVNWDDYSNFGPCLDSSYVTHSKAEDGYGPLMYDVAIEATGGLMSDRTEVSGEAEAVWDYYMKKRPDVQVDQLDITKDFGVPQLTPDYKKDDCSQVPAFDLYGPGWDGTGISQKISKAGSPVIDELRSRGMLN